MEILTNTNPILRQVCLPVTDFNEETSNIINNLYSTLKECSDGSVAIAAPQIGYSSRIFVVHFSGYRLIAINPKISKSFGKQLFEEGCLSVPDKFGIVERASEIEVEYYDQFGKFHVDKFSDLLSVVVQHEIDHLDGILFVDKLYAN